MDELKQPGIVLNIDINTATSPFLRSVVANPNPTEIDLFPFVDIYADTQITDLCFNIFCQYSATPSTVFSDACFKYHQTEENGHAVSYEKRHGAIAELYEIHNLDPYRIWLRRCHKIGLRGWLSIRMNDCHCPDDATCFLRSSFFYEAKKRNWMIGDDFGYYRYCFNYAVPEVRKLMLAYIEEQLRQYPEADGLELDFMREPYCFSMTDLPNGVAIMNSFIQQVHTLVKQIEQESNRTIPIMIRVPRDLSTALDFGFDAVTWAKEGWCDAIVPSPRWETTDSDIPIDQWKEALQDCPVYAGLEILVNRTALPATFTNEAITRGYAHAYWSMGADKIYLYNYFTLPAGMPCHHLDYEDVVEIYRTCGHPETARQDPRRTIVTFQDIAIHEDNRYKPLPISVPSGKSTSITVATGPSTEKNLLLVGLNTVAQPPQILCNGEVCPLLGADTRENPYPYPGTRLFRYALPVFSTVRQDLTFTARTEDVTVSYLEIETDNP